MLKHPYLINLGDPDDCVEHYIDRDRNLGFVKERMNLLVENLEFENTHELTYSVFYKDDVATCHAAKRGCETMIIGEGEIELVSRGRKCIVSTGDILHFGAFDSHSMRWLKDTPWVGYFNKMNITQPATDKEYLSQHCPDMTDQELAAIFDESYDLVNLAQPVTVDTPKSEIEGVRAPEFAFAEFDLEGVKLRLKVGRWETQGQFELWQLQMEQSFYAACARPCPKPSIFYVTKGNVHFKVFNDEFDAPANSIVHLPPYAIFSFEAQEASAMYDYDSACMMFDLLSEFKSYRTFAPEKLEDPAFTDSLKKKWGNYITEFGRR